MKAVQYFDPDYIERCKKMTPDQIAKFLDDFRMLHRPSKLVKTKLISLKVEEDLLEAFKFESNIQEIPYQTQIKKLMREWLVKRN